MSQWKEYKLGDISEDIAMGPFGSNLKTDNFIPSGVPVIRGGNLNENGFTDDKFVFVSEKKAQTLKRSLAYPNELVFTHRGTIGQVAIIPENQYPYYLVSQSQMRLKVNDKFIIPKYLYYWFKSTTGQYELLKNSAQVGVPSIASPTKSLKEIDIKLPPLPTQTAIASILSSLDQKIELNNAINRNLEALAQALFKQWFVEFNFPVDQHGNLSPLSGEMSEGQRGYKDSGGEMTESELGMIPKEWRVSKLSELVEIGSSKRIFSKEYVSEGIPFYRGKEIIELSKGNNISTELFISKERFLEIKNKFGAPKVGDILITSVGTIGQCYLVSNGFDFYFKDGNLTWIKNYKSFITPSFIYTWLKNNETQQQIKSVTIGSTQQAITISALNELKVISPPASLSNSFSDFANYAYRYVSENNNEVEKLQKIRDTLLPKLISGELEVKDINTVSV